MSLIKRNRDRAGRFENLAEGKTEKEKRKLETQLLKPEPVPQYTGDMPENYGIDALTVSIVFSNEKVKALAEKFLKISFSKVKRQQYITDITLLVDMLKQMDKGKLIYKDGEFYSEFLEIVKEKKKKKKRKL